MARFILCRTASRSAASSGEGNCSSAAAVSSSRLLRFEQQIGVGLIGVGEFGRLAANELPLGADDLFLQFDQLARRLALPAAHLALLSTGHLAFARLLALSIDLFKGAAPRRRTCRKTRRRG